MKCLSCQKPISDTAKFCNFCGANQAELKVIAQVEADKIKVEKINKQKVITKKIATFGVPAIAVVAIIWGFIAYNQSQNINLNEIKDPVLNTSASTGLIEEHLKSKFQFIPSLNCYRMVYAFNDSNFLYCVKLTEILETKEDGKDFFYMTLTGVAIDDNNELLEYRAAPGVVELTKLEYVGGKFKSAAKRYVSQSGSFGKPNTVKIIPIGKDNYGWASVGGWAGMGTVSLYLNLTSVVKGAVRDILTMTTQFDNKDACDPTDKTCSFVEMNLKIEQIKSNEEYFPIKVSGYLTEGTLAKSNKVTKDFKLNYDAKTGKYILPAELNKILNDLPL